MGLDAGPPPVPAGAGRRALTALLALLAAGLGGCGTEQGGEPAGGGEPRAVGVDGATVRADTLSVTIRAVGSLEADASVDVKPEVDGHVTEILYEEGAEVERGEVMLRLDQNKLRAEVEAARARLTRARSERQNLERQLERNDRLLEQGAISQQAYDDLETGHESAVARVEEAEANLSLARQRLEDATIRAPFDGRAGARSFDLGDFVRVGETLFTVVDDDPLEIRFSVPERYLGRLSLGSPVSVRVQSFPDRRFEGRVDYVGPFVDPANRTVDLKARIPNPASELRPGQFADVILQLEERRTLLVPEAALLPRQDGVYVFRASGGRAEEVRISVGERKTGVAEVLSGLQAGDTVVVAGQQRLRDGSAVTVSLGGGAGADVEALEVGSGP